MILKRPRMCVVDGNKVAAQYLPPLLEDAGLDATCIDSAETFFTTTEPDHLPDLIILDCATDKTTEIAFIERLDQELNGSTVPVIITNPAFGDEAPGRAYDAAVVHHHPKPIDSSAFIRSVNHVMGWSPNRRVPKRAPALIIEHVGTTAMIISKLLEVLGVKSIVCKSHKDLDTYLKVVFPELIALDMWLKDGDAATVCRQIRSRGRMDELPIVLVSGTQDMKSMISCLREGANDHIAKPIVKEEFFARLSNILKVRTLQKDLQQQKMKLENLAFTDPLTTLFNRAYMNMALKRELDRCRRSGASLAFLMVDLDFFKQVNDNHGHEVGDEVLREFSSLLKANVRSYDIPCRYGGEEFCVLLPGTTSANVITVAERIRSACENRLFSSRQFKQTISIGTTVYPELSTPQSLIGDADKALYQAKQGGRNQTILAPAKQRDTAS